MISSPPSPPTHCPELECGEPVNGWHGLARHQADTGDVPLTPGRCAVLYRQRNRTVA